MKHIILCAFAALALAACETTSADPADSSMKMQAEPMPEPMEKICPIENPDGTCACEVVDDAGDCVEGGGSGVIIPGGGSGVIIPSAVSE